MEFTTPNNTDLQLSIVTESIELTVEQLGQLSSIDDLINELRYRESENLPELDDSINAAVSILNRQYSVVMLGGKTRIAMEVASGAGRYELNFIAPAEWEKFNAHLKIPYIGETANGKKKRKNFDVTKAFIESPDTTRFNKVEFNPAIVGDYGKTKNLFKGFPFTHENNKEKLSLAYDICTKSLVLTHVNKHYPKASRFFEHIFDNVADGNNNAALQFIAWIADMLQNPARTPMIAPVLRSDEKGTGKSVVASIIGALVGKAHYFKTSEPQQVIGKFNSHLANALFVCGEEMSWGGSIETNSKIKDAVTAAHIPIEMKGIDIIMMRKYYRLMLVTNSSWAVSASKDERRFLIFDVANYQSQNNDYFAPFFSGNGLSELMLKDLFSFLMNCDYSKIDLSKGEKTNAILNQKIESMSPLEQWWSYCLANGEIGHSFGELGENFTRITKAAVHEAYLDWLDKFKPKSSERLTNQRTFGTQFVKMARCGNSRLVKADNIKLDRTKNAYEFGKLDDLREAFENQF